MVCEIKITAGVIVQIIGFSIAIAGLWVAVSQMRATSKVNRTKFIFDLTNELFKEGETRKFFYKIDYEKFTFVVKEFQGSDEERWLDAILYRYDVIGRMVKTKVIPLNEIEYVLFEMVQVYKNPEVQKYLEWLDTEFEKHGQLGKSKRRRAHDDFRWLAESISASK